MRVLFLPCTPVWAYAKRNVSALEPGRSKHLAASIDEPTIPAQTAMAALAELGKPQIRKLVFGYWSRHLTGLCGYLLAARLSRCLLTCLLSPGCGSAGSQFRRFILKCVRYAVTCSLCCAFSAEICSTICRANVDIRPSIPALRMRGLSFGMPVRRSGAGLDTGCGPLIGYCSFPTVTVSHLAHLQNLASIHPWCSG